jgi:hypothetical protein
VLNFHIVTTHESMTAGLNFSRRSELCGIVVSKNAVFDNGSLMFILMLVVSSCVLPILDLGRFRFEGVTRRFWDGIKCHDKI